MAKASSPREDHIPLYQDVARFRAILFDAILKPYDMTLAQGWVLVHLMREDGLRQLELAERMDIATVTTSKLIDRLESRGYVERRPDPTDRRSNRIYARPSAGEAIKVLTKAFLTVEALAKQGISDEDIKTTLRVLTRMKSNLKEALAER